MLTKRAPTEIIPGTPGRAPRAEQVLCPAPQPAGALPVRGNTVRMTVCWTPFVVLPGGSISGPQICYSTWGTIVGQ